MPWRMRRVAGPPQSMYDGEEGKIELQQEESPNDGSATTAL